MIMTAFWVSFFWEEEVGAVAVLEIESIIITTASVFLVRGRLVVEEAELPWMFCGKITTFCLTYCCIYFLISENFS